MLWARPDKAYPMLLQNFREAGIFGEETIAWMDGIGAGDLTCREKARDVEIAFAGSRRADAHAFVGQADVHGVRVGRRVYRNCCDP